MKNNIECTSLKFYQKKTNLKIIKKIIKENYFKNLPH